jgi:hypothetical protein
LPLASSYMMPDKGGIITTNWSERGA